MSHFKLEPAGPWRPNESTGPLRKMLLALAARVADNRQVAGVHYPIDTLAGRLLGTTLAGFLEGRCFDGGYLRGTFVPTDGKDPDTAGLDLATNSDPSSKLERVDGALTPSLTLQWLWNEARKEWGLEPMGWPALASEAV